MTKRIAIIGAGISGLTLAQCLNEKAQVTVFEKARGMGGRMSTRYADPFFFDHGTQYFTARHPEFRAFVAHLLAHGVIAEWKGTIAHLSNTTHAQLQEQQEPYYVAMPHMNSLCKHLATGIDVVPSCEITPLQGTQSPWVLHDISGRLAGTFDWVISTAPPAQSQRLLQNHFITQAQLQGCFALMLGFNQLWQGKWIAAECSDSIIRWIGINSTKPGRNPQNTSIVVHADNAWSQQHMDDEPAEVQVTLASQFHQLTGLDPHTASYQSLHRWRYALNTMPLKMQHYADYQKGLACAGDWQSHSRIEDVWLQAKELALSILQACR